MAKKNYCIIDDTKQTITFVADKLTKKEQETIKGLIAIGYKANRTTAEELYPSKNIYSKENVYKFLKSKGKEAEEAFKAEAEAVAIDKETGAAKTYKNGKPRKKGYVGALKKFRAEYEEEFLKFIND